MTTPPVWLEDDQLASLVAVLERRGYRVIGPRVEDGELTLGELEAGEGLPAGWHDQAGPGSYRLFHEDDDPLAARERFGYRVGAPSWKRVLHPPDAPLFGVERGRGSGMTLRREPGPDRPLALLGVRPCDLAAIGVQDRVLLGGPHVDAHYAERRRDAFLVAVECTRPGATCFCASMGTGPGAGGPFDLALTELLDERRHGFLARAGSDVGHEVLAALGGRPASDDERRERDLAVGAAAERMGRTLDAAAARSALAEGAELPFWSDVAERCLSCANCTMVCPTCFCTTVEDRADLQGREAERRRLWDSCFSVDFSYLHGGSVRRSVAARYRQWLSHKLSAWYEQFGESGCVGCGRCIAWCPVGIDITREAATAVSQAEDARAHPPTRGPATKGGRP